MSHDPLRSQLLKGTTPYLVLAVVRDGELYGYQTVSYTHLTLPTIYSV